MTPPLPTPSTLERIDVNDKYLLPDVIVWDPVKRYPDIVSEALCVCYEEGCTWGKSENALLARWEKAELQSKMPIWCKGFCCSMF